MVYFGSQFQRFQYIVTWLHTLEQNSGGIMCCGRIILITKDRRRYQRLPIAPKGLLLLI